MRDTGPGLALLFLRDEELRQGLDLLHAAGRDLGAAVEPLLDARGLGAGHLLVLRALAAEPGLAVGELAAAVGVTKQSLGRLTRTLAEAGLLHHKVGPSDRRERLLALTDAGLALERELWERLRPRIAKAWRDCGPQAVDGFRSVLLGLVDRPADRRRFERPRRDGAA